MKMVAAAKLKIAQTRLEPAVSFLETSTRVLKGVKPGDMTGADTTVDEKAPHLIVMITTDRGLCGAVTSNVVRRSVEESKQLPSVQFASVGTKGQDNLVGQGRAAQLGVVAAELSTKPPNYAEVSFLAETLLKKNISGVTIVYNHFINMLTNKMSVAKFISIDQLRSADKWQETEFDDEDCFQVISAERRRRERKKQKRIFSQHTNIFQ
jgi:F-type H+-transporting ATPase subunit gamma